MTHKYQIDQMEPMPLIRFWSIIDTARSGVTATEEADSRSVPEHVKSFVEAQTVAALLEDELVHLSTQEICEFFLRATKLQEDGVGEAWSIMDDHQLFGHQFFMAWLVYQGRTTFEAVVNNPAPAMYALAAAKWEVYELSAPFMQAEFVYADRTGESLI